MKQLLYTCLLFLCPLYLHAQANIEYKRLTTEAEALYNNKYYKEAAESYLAAFHSGYKMLSVRDIYGAACAMAQAGMTDSAFSELNMVANAGFPEYEHLMADTDLASLHADARWDALCSKVKENKDKKDKEEANYNKALIAILDTVYTDDQADRSQTDAMAGKLGRDSKEFKELMKARRAKDSVNVLKVTKILDQYGWLGPDVVSPQGSRTLFLVIQHAHLETQEKYLSMMREAVQHKKASASNLALLEDRVAMG